MVSEGHIGFHLATCMKNILSIYRPFQNIYIASGLLPSHKVSRKVRTVAHIKMSNPICFHNESQEAKVLTHCDKLPGYHELQKQIQKVYTA